MIRHSVSRVVAGLALVLAAACSAMQPVSNPVQVRLEASDRAPEATQLPYLCQGGMCAVSPQVFLDERDVRGASLLQEGESQGLLVLEFNDAGKAKLNILTRSNLGRRMVFVQDSRVLGTLLIDRPWEKGRVELQGSLPDLRRIYQELTVPKRNGSPIEAQPAPAPEPKP